MSVFNDNRQSHASRLHGCLFLTSVHVSEQCSQFCTRQASPSQALHMHACRIEFAQQHNVISPDSGPGVNPMITTESIAYMVGEGMAAKYSKLLKRRSPVKLQYEHE